MSEKTQEAIMTVGIIILCSSSFGAIIGLSALAIDSIEHNETEWEIVHRAELYNEFYITGYTPNESETDSDPCIASRNVDICHDKHNIDISNKDLVFACPRSFSLGTKLEIEGIGYGTCLDRTSKKFDGRIDVLVPNQDKAREITGWRVIKIIKE